MQMVRSKWKRFVRFTVNSRASRVLAFIEMEKIIPSERINAVSNHPLVVGVFNPLLWIIIRIFFCVSLLCINRPAYGVKGKYLFTCIITYTLY